MLFPGDLPHCGLQAVEMTPCVQKGEGVRLFVDIQGR